MLSHDTSQPEPVFVYGNRAALQLFECEWAQLIGTPSSRSAEPVEPIQTDRSAALAAALEKGFIDDYEGWRTSFQGTRFRISGATVFNVEAPGGERVGQAALIRSWEWEDGSKGGEGVEEEEQAVVLAPGEEPPSADEMAAAEAAVGARGAAVRALKEEQGLTNADEEVQAAVAQLLKAKAALEGLKKKAAAGAAATAS